MDAAPQSLIDPAIWTRNLEALQQVDPALVGVLAQLPAPASIGAIPARTRDGQVNFVLSNPVANESGEATAPRWFGRTSIPLTRAVALLEQFESGQANVLLPTVGEGTEARLLLQRLPSHRAVFVWEPDPQAIYLTLHLHDYQRALLQRRLVWVHAPEDRLTESLVQWLRENPGHLCPNRILVWPWQSLPQLGACRSAIEAAYRQIEQERQARLADLRREIRTAVQLRPCSGAGSSALGIFSVHPRPEVWALGDGLLEAARSMDRPAQAWSVRSPADVHSQMRAGSFAQFLTRTDLPIAALLLDITRNELADTLPPECSAISWFGPAALMSDLASRLGPQDRLAVTDPRVRARALQAGIAAERMELCPFPALTVPELSPQPRDIDVLVLADRLPTSAEAHGYTLASHVRVWNTALEVLAGEIEEFVFERGANLLDRAERKTGARLEHDTHRQAMLETLSGGVAASLLWQFLVGSLSREGIRCRVHGYGWGNGHGTEVSADRPSPAQQAELALRSKIFLHADPAGSIPLTLLTAAGCGAVACVRNSRLDAQPGGIASLLKPGSEYVPFTRARELVSAIRKLLADEPARARIADAARQHCQTAHLPIHRLQTLQRAIG